VNAAIFFVLQFLNHRRSDEHVSAATVKMPLGVLCMPLAFTNPEPKNLVLLEELVGYSRLSGKIKSPIIWTRV
jgi:hypothetical protein